jgi:hypothetical protein
MAWAVDEIAIPHEFGHAFIWGNIPVNLKNGTTKYYKTIITYVCAGNLPECVKLCESMGAKNVYVNMD